MKGRFLKPLSRSLRRQETEAEAKLWARLRNRRFLGIKFRRQQPVGRYILDFCSLEHKLAIELDGGQHAVQQAEDVKRTGFLNAEGFRVFRVWNHEVLANIESVLEYIRIQICESPSPHPLPLRERVRPKD